MSHKGIRLLIEDTAKSLGEDIQFTYARTSDFNLMRDKRYPFITLDPLNSTAAFAVNNTSNFSQTWSVQMAFYELDNEASTGDEYAKILDSTSDLVDNFFNKLNFYADNYCLTSDDILLTGFNKQSFVKATADVLTGHILTFQIQVTDKFDYCGLGC